jgi:AraC-like DNA-binding protein
MSAVDLARGPDFRIRAVTCDARHDGWSATEVHDGYSVVLVRRGRFRWHAGGEPADVDPTVGYLCLPAQEQRFAHPAGGDTCTSVSLGPALWRSVVGADLDAGRRPTQTMYVDGRLDLAHRRLLAAAGTGDVDYAVTEGLLRLVSVAAGRVCGVPAPAGGAPIATGAAGRDRAVVAAARDAILTDVPEAAGLRPLAALLGVSPYRLSRAFVRELGVSLTWYRNRVRVGRALERIEEGESSLGRLAVDLGFADQAHLCRTVRRHLGHPPSALRRLLTPQVPARTGPGDPSCGDPLPV